MIDLTEKLKIVLLKQKISQKELALRTNQSTPNLSRKLMHNDFKLSEFEKLVNALGCKLIINIELPNKDIV